MKHILNNLSEIEKNSIREQHTGGMKIMNENFSKLINSKLGDSKPFVSEEKKEMDEQANARVQSLVNFLKQNKFSPTEIQQAQSQLNAPQQAQPVVKAGSASKGTGYGA